MATYPATQESVDELVSQLMTILANTGVLYFKTLNFHWNMVGERFFMYHRLLEEQYKHLADALDEIAEHVRSFGKLAPGSMQALLNLSQLKESSNTLSQDAMIQELINDHTQFSGWITQTITLSDKLHNHATSDLLAQRVLFHNKAAWLLRSHFKL